MIRIDNNLTITFMSKEAAEALAASNAADDPDSEYQVIKNDAGKFFVAIYEDGDLVGTL